MATAILEGSTDRRWRPPALVLSDGAIELLKWAALFFMSLDHVNKYLLHDSSVILFDLGRVVMPTFAIVLGYNLARPCSHAFRRVTLRLAAYGAIASVPFIALGGLGWGWWPLNIMATLLAATVICGLLNAGGRRRAWLAAFAFLGAGVVVEFWWPGIAICVCAWSYTKRPNWTALAIGVACLAALYVINWNAWALAALPLIWGASRVRLQVPRAGSFFYKYYAGHLAVIYVMAHLPAVKAVGGTP